MASQLKVDTITGVTTAGSVAVTGEGNSTTTNLQQGLSKKWLYFKGTSTTEIKDSFNCASISDNGTGDTTTNMTTAFNTAFYSFTGNCSYGSTNNPRTLSAPYNDAINTTYIRIGSGYSGGKEDTAYNMLSIDGDLA